MKLPNASERLGRREIIGIRDDARWLLECASTPPEIHRINGFARNVLDLCSQLLDEPEDERTVDQ